LEDGEKGLQRKKVSIAIPASVVADTPHLREKTSKIGLIGRAAAIFGVDQIVIYPDNPKTDQGKEMNLIRLLLSYMETPQYLRKRLFKLQPELQFAGILSPLRTPHHPLNAKAQNLEVGEYREGATVSKTDQGTLVDIGVERPALVCDVEMSMNKRITVRIAKVGKEVEAEVAGREETQEYWGYSATIERRPLGKILEDKTFDLAIATSRYGIPFAQVAKEMKGEWEKSSNIFVAFGSPARGLHEIVKTEGLSLPEVVDFVVNTIPFQGTKTVRTEEALIASLAVLRACVSNV
jgi:predicted SPOUT superfamily RNA methylase MTH1